MKIINNVTNACAEPNQCRVYKGLGAPQLSVVGVMQVGAAAFLVAWLVGLCQGNLEGPFLFFGPRTLEKYRRTALRALEQDDLMRIYGEQPAIVVFNNQDAVPLSSGYFPRLRKMLERLTVIALPQDFLDVHPDYVSNETQVGVLNTIVTIS